MLLGVFGECWLTAFTTFFAVITLTRQPPLLSLPGCVNRAFRFANAAIDAFVGVNDKHVLTLIEAVHRTHLDTVHVLAANAALIDDVGQLSLLSSGTLRTALREAADL